MLGVKTCRAARTCCAGRARWCSQPLSQCAGPGRPGGIACRGTVGHWPAGCMLGDGARDSASFDPQHTGAPFCDVICIRSIEAGILSPSCGYTYTERQKKLITSSERHILKSKAQKLIIIGHRLATPY